MSSEKRISIQGEVYYLPRIALPAGCTLTVTLNDSSLADAAAEVIAVSKTDVTQQVPLPFDMGYVGRLHPVQGHTYTLSARIEHEGRLLWINDNVQVIDLTGDDQTDQKIKVVQVLG
jgi:putative lipoprotein